VLDFTSALYLGLEHASRGLPGWDRLTLGKPAALESQPGAGRVERRLATLIGCERTLLVTSSLHLFWDLFTLLAKANVNIFLDTDSYPIIQWGVERAACSGTLVKRFQPHDHEALRKVLTSADGRPPVIVTDGYCPRCGRLAPIREYLALAEARRGFVVVDDSQALGIFGKPSLGVVYGTGGGGSMQRAGVISDRLIIGSSLAKAFGIPVAVLAGSAEVINDFESRSATRVHCSPPSAADISATHCALRINESYGDSLRMALAQRVSRFRKGLRKLGLIAIPSPFPLQPIRLPDDVEAKKVHEQLSARGVETVLHRGTRSKDARMSFVITARHSSNDIDQTLSLMTCVLANQKRSATRRELTR
jgi:8-amino-7-oxononanoate synthase